MNRGCYAKNPNSMRQQVEDLLKDHGGMTISDLIDELPAFTKGGISKTICDLRDQGVVYIKDWEMTQPGQKRHPRPVWDHASNSKRQPPHNKQRPLPPTNATRLKKRRLERKRFSTQTRYILKIVKSPIASAE